MDGAVYAKVEELEATVTESADAFSTMAIVKNNVVAGEDFLLHPDGTIESSAGVDTVFVEAEDVIPQYKRETRDRMTMAKVSGVENRYIRAYKGSADRSMIIIELLTINDATGFPSILHTLTKETNADDKPIELVMDDVQPYFIITALYPNKMYAYAIDNTTITYIGEQSISGLDSSDYYDRGYAFRNGVGVMLDYTLPKIFKFEVTSTSFNVTLSSVALGVNTHEWGMGIWDEIDSYYFISNYDLIKITLNPSNYASPTVQVLDIGTVGIWYYRGHVYLHDRTFIGFMVLNGVLSVNTYNMDTDISNSYTKQIGIDVGNPREFYMMRQDNYIRVSPTEVWYGATGDAITSLAKFWFVDGNNFGVEKIKTFTHVSERGAECLIDYDTITSKMRMIFVNGYGSSYGSNTPFSYKSFNVEKLGIPRVNGFILEDATDGESIRLFFTENVFKNTEATVGSIVKNYYGVLANGSLVPIK